MKGLFYHFCPGGDIGHGVHLFRLAESLKIFSKNRLKITLLRDADAVYPPDRRWKCGPFIPLASGLARNKLKRQKVLLSALCASKPEFLLTAYFPFGRTACAGEIVPVLKLAKSSGIKIYASVPMPYFSHSEKNIKDLFDFAGLYDRIFIHSPAGFDLKYMAAAVPFEKRITSRRFLEVFRALKTKLCFTGYVMPPLPRIPPKGKAGRFILIHRGGGSTSPDIITCAILAKELLKSGLPMTVVAGPASSDAEMRSWRALIKNRGIKGVTLLMKTENLFGLLAGSAVSAGTAGGTAYEVLYLNKKTVLIPFKGFPGAEHSDQLARAAMLKELAGAAVLDYDSLTPEILARELDLSLLHPAPAFEPDPGAFNGAEVFAAEVLGASLRRS
ncbi:MAG: hypothetical protein WCK75_08675 [Elusimicrobiota bacterium]